MSEKTITLNDQIKYRANFIGENGKLFLVYCAACKQENYGPMVAIGTCAMCGWAEKKE